MTRQGRVYLVGAGPGDPELLTLKAARLLREADVLLYDHLVNAELLKMVRPNCQLVPVGKRCGSHPVPQEQINDLLVHYGLQPLRVVRLKGGDPFVFGRGGEELQSLVDAGIAFEVVPGVSSALAAPAYAGIPVTHRQLAASFAVVTGHEATEKSEYVDWSAFAKVDTLVVLMGVKNRQSIARELISLGRPKEMPVAFIQEATLGEQKVVLTNLNELATNPPAVSSPSVMVIGEVARFHQQFNWFVSEEHHSSGFIPVRELTAETPRNLSFPAGQSSSAEA